MSKYNLIIVPEGSAIPEDLTHLVTDAADVVEKIAAGANGRPIVAVNTRELQLLVEYRDMFDLDCTAIIGLSGAMYSTVWNTYVATMERTTLDALRAQLRSENDDSARAGTSAIVAPSKTDRVQRLRDAGREVEADEDDFSGDR